MASDQDSPLEWRTVAGDFEADGALRDIYVLDATLADWQVALDHVRQRYAPLKFRVDSRPTVLPEHVADIFPPENNPHLNSCRFGPYCVAR